MILVAVGTFIQGFDALVRAADAATAGLGLPGFAQIGHGRVLPRHLAWSRFLDEPDFRRRLAAARLVVCHGGMGIVGDAMRAGRPILAVPRRGATTRGNPANDQLAFVERLAERHPIAVCTDLGRLGERISAVLAGPPPPLDYALTNDVPGMLAAFLGSTAGAPGTPSAGPRPRLV
ncbi:MAG TPA: glycosyltransferase [Geminicoccaceae bacterium]|nr:glycosyltransferase [Geminicoccaceae bacterium]